MSGFGRLGSRIMGLGSFARIALIIGSGIVVFALLVLLVFLLVTHRALPRVLILTAIGLSSGQA